MPLLILLLAIAFAVSPFLVPDFGGFDPEQYPVPQVDPPAQPAGWAFSIWPVIYLWLIACAAYGVLRRRDDRSWRLHRAPLAISLAIGAIWLAVAVASPIWATVLIWAMLLSGIGAYVTAPQRDRWWAQAPIGLYAGWLTAASFVSLALLGAGYGVVSLGVAAWMALLGALVTGAAIASVRPGVTYPVAIAWAAIGLTAQNWGTALGWAALTGAVLLLYLAFRGLKAG